jgi:hypothetical protein
MMNQCLNHIDSGVRNNMPVDLRTCKEGDVLISKHGERLTYVGPLPENNYYDHEVRYANGSYGSRNNDGSTYRKNSLPEDHDIVEIIHKETNITEERDWLKYLLSQVYMSLPKNRDWLDPDIEFAIKHFLKEKQDGSRT